MSDRQIISFFSNRQENICGRFQQEQLNREISAPVNTCRRPLISIAAMVAALTVLIPSVQAKGQPEKIQMVPDKSNAIMSAQQSDTVPRIITGIVRDSTNNTVVHGAYVEMKGQPIHTTTDSSGKFELQIPNEFTEKTVTLKVYYIGLMTQEVTIPLTSEINAIDIPMQYVDIVSVMAGGVVVSKKATLWERFKGIFR